MSKKKILGIIFILLGLIILTISYYKDYKKEKIEYLLLDNYFKNLSSINYINNNLEDEYIAVLEIPKINLKRGLYSLESEKNNVKYNIEILSESKMPEEKNSNLILASHSGNAKNAYFKNLKDLELNDISYIYYNNKKYTYKVTNIYEVEKDGSAEIIRNVNNNTLTMITCNQEDKTKQIVIISELC